MDRRRVLLGYALGIGLVVWQAYLIWFTPLFPLPVKAVFGLLAGFVLVMSFLMWKYFGPAMRPVLAPA